MKYSLFVFLAFASTAFAEEKTYGTFSQPTKDQKVLSLKEAIADLKTLNSKEGIYFSGKVDRVCQMKGCWMVMKEGDQAAQVTFKNYGFFLPKNSGKKSALLRGKIFMKELSEAEARHYAEDDGKSAQEIAAIHGKSQRVWIEAEGVKLF